MDTVNSIVEPLPVGSAAEASAVSEQAELLNPPAFAGLSQPTAEDNLDQARVFFFGSLSQGGSSCQVSGFQGKIGKLKRYIKNGQGQNVRKTHFSTEQQDPELQLHWQTVPS